MCGIFGLIKGRKDKVFPEEITEPLRVLAHRGPDGQGTFIRRNIGLGHNRLSIFDLSDAGAQPMTLGDNTITFNGAIYNFPELKKELQQAGYTFKSQTDTEMILAAYDHWGTDCVHHFNGQWAFAIYDEKQKLLFCSRDRFGIKPFYYTWIKGQFCFASEIKAFTKIKGWQAKLNRVRAYEYLVYGYHDHTSETLFERVYQLSKGHHLIFDLKQHKENAICYYKLENKTTSTLSFPKVREEFQFLLRDAVQLRLRSDVTVGSALSGGLDSSSIVANTYQILQAKHKSVKQYTISACFPGFEKDESKWIDAMINRYDLSAKKIYPQAKDFFEKIEQLTWIQDEPLAGASLYAQYTVFQTARASNIPVMLDGQGADEILAGYDKFFLPFFKRLVLKKSAKAISELFHYFIKHRITPYQAWETLMAFQKKKAQTFPSWLHPDFKIDSAKLFQRTKEHSIQQTSLNSIYEMGLSALLHYEDRNAMAWGVESRLPFLDHRLVEFCLSLPDQFKISKGKRKYILRSAMDEQLPDSILNRFDKVGFAAPQEQWLERYSYEIDNAFRFLKKDFDHIFSFANEGIKSQAMRWRMLAFRHWTKVFRIETPASS